MKHLDRMAIIIAHNIDEYVDEFSQVYNITSKFNLNKEKKAI